MIFGGATDGDSNQARNRHGGAECMVVNALEVELGQVIGFGPGDLVGVMVPHNDAMVIQTTVANYDVV